MRAQDTDFINEPAFCANCLRFANLEAACRFCRSGRIIRHPELAELALAHLDCDAFYAAIEKRDNPSLADRPVIVGGERRGVVTTACYIARTYGVRSAMPMFRALALCPNAVVIKPNMSKYIETGRAVKRMMNAITPLVEPVSIDEAFMDLAGTQRLHGAYPAMALARLQQKIEAELGVTVSIGLSHNKFLAKLASDLDKPRGFSVIGRAETRARLATMPVSAICRVGAKMTERLRRDGLTLIGHIQEMDEAALSRKYGEAGLKLARLSRGEDARDVSLARETKSVSSETTFGEDLGDIAALEDWLWKLAEKTAARMKKQGLVGRVVVLKLKDTRFRSITRQVSLDRPTNLARIAFAAARPLLRDVADGRKWRLIGVGFADLSPTAQDPQAELFGAPQERIAAQESAIDTIRSKFGDSAIAAGRVLIRRRD
jgi:DNA polymerase-4